MKRITLLKTLFSVMILVYILIFILVSKAHGSDHYNINSYSLTELRTSIPPTLGNVHNVPFDNTYLLIVELK